MSHLPPSGQPPYYGYPPPPNAPGAFAYVPAPTLIPMYPPPQEAPPPPTYVTNYIYPPQPVPEPQPEPVHVVDNSYVELVDWAPATTANAISLIARAYLGGREGWDDSPLWIIRAHHRGSLIPGKLAIKHRCAYIPYAGQEIPVHNFEILCAAGYAVRWLGAKNGSVPPGAIVAGNTDTAEPLYIGRVGHRGSITPGKVHPNHGCCYISFDGSEVSYRKYEVLCKVGGY